MGIPQETNQNGLLKPINRPGEGSRVTNSLFTPHINLATDLDFVAGKLEEHFQDEGGAVCAISFESQSEQCYSPTQTVDPDTARSIAIELWSPRPLQVFLIKNPSDSSPV